MTNRIDEEYQFYKTQLSVSSGNFIDLKRKFYQTELTATTDNIYDLEVDWLVFKGVTKSNVDDMWKTFLEGEGYSGNVEDMRKQYYEDNN